MLKIIAIKVGDTGYCLAEKDKLDRYDGTSLICYLFDGMTPQKTFNKDWVFVKNLPQKISQMKKQPDINYRYELIDTELSSIKIPLVINRDDVAVWNDGYYIWNDKMKPYESLYRIVSDKQPDIENFYEFEIEEIMQVSEIKEPTKFGFNIQKTQWVHEGVREITSSDVNYKIIEKIFYPEILLPQRPCFFTSEQTYKIVRQYIKDNIDGRYATITSDYDFCFTVKRRIPLAKLKTYTVDVNNSIFQKRKKKPKYVENRISERTETCFDMTHSGENYKGYTPIKGFEATTQEELKEKINEYCKNLIEFINTPFVDCPHCNGDGVILSTVSNE